MDNPEEVLQALDEFSKMRPTEIPRELEDYLCFVAKTGDPVYQWSLIKPLFREKLVRVMTDFYENCPALDLASSPNIEHFNYDIMKCNLLELLESFASAPFTVQRICELLTAPRKQYNRVDKFMRAIEKNILVVSTKEPGPAARRSENGDSMVNGSMDDEETPNTESSHEIEMESWVKDCSTESSVSLPPADHDTSLVETVTPSSKPTKDPSIDDSLPGVHDKNQSSTSPRLDMSVSNFIAAHEMSNTPALSTSTTVDTSILCNSNIVNSTPEEVMPSIVNEVPEAIMNEDTSSQPSLESENNDESEANGRKLQTTFQAKDFSKVDDIKSSNYYDENNETTDNKNSTHNDVDTHAHENVNSPIKKEEEEEVTDSSSPDDDLETPEKRSRLDNDIINTNESKEYNKNELSPTPCENTDNPLNDESFASEKTSEQLINEIDNKNSDKTNLTESNADTNSVENQEEITPAFITTSTSDSEPSKESSDECNDDSPVSNSTPETPKPIIEEPVIESSSSESSQESTKSDEQPPLQQLQQCNVIIEEAMDDDIKPSNTLVPDPIPIVEEPKDESTSSVSDNEPIISKVDNYPKNDEELRNSTEISAEMTNSSNLETEITDDHLKADNLQKEDAELTSITPVEKEDEPAELMDVDNEEAIPTSTTFNQDEPMEEESAELRS